MFLKDFVQCNRRVSFLTIENIQRRACIPNYSVHFERELGLISFKFFTRRVCELACLQYKVGVEMEHAKRY